MILLIIYRIISAFATILIVAPIYILYCIILFLFTLCNNLIYVNFMQIDVPKELLDKFGEHRFVFLRFITAIAIALTQFQKSLKNLKTIRF